MIKILREATGLGLKEAKDMAEGTPIKVGDRLGLEQAQDLVRRLQDVGARASVH